MHASSWRGVALWREALFNIGARGSRLRVLLCIAVLCAVGATMFAAYRWDGFLYAQESRVAAGLTTVVFDGADARDPVVIDRESCEALGEQPDVAVAGGTQGLGSETFLQLGSDVPVVAVSSALAPPLRTVDVVVGGALGFTGKKRALLMPDGRILRAGVLPSPPEGVNLGSAVLVPLNPQDLGVQRCVVTLTRFADMRTAPPRLASSLRVSGGAMIMTAGATTNPAAEFAQRDDRYLPLVLGGFLGAVGIAFTRFRSSDIATYRFSGTSRRSMFQLLFFEQTLLAGAFVVAGALSTLVLASWLLAPAINIIWLSAGACGWLIISAAQILLTGADPSSLSKDR